MTLIEPSWDAARICAAELGKPGPTELIALEKCADRILAIDAKSLVDLPTYETSAMDGYESHCSGESSVKSATGLSGAK